VTTRPQRHDAAFRDARRCYDHLAGRLGVAITEALLRDDRLRAEAGEFQLTVNGEALFDRLTIDWRAARRARRRYAFACLDVTERRPHLAGALGAALADGLIARGWLLREPGRRSLRITTQGRRALPACLGLSADGLSSAGAPPCGC
jgi:hypothetical protein